MTTTPTGVILLPPGESELLSFGLGWSDAFFPERRDEIVGAIHSATIPWRCPKSKDWLTRRNGHVCQSVQPGSTLPLEATSPAFLQGIPAILCEE